MKCNFTVICENAIVDIRTNQLSLLGILETVKAASFPLSFPKLDLVCVITKEEGDLETVEGYIDLKVGRDPPSRMPIEVDFGGKRGTRIITEIQGLEISEPAIIKAKIVLAGKVIGKCNVAVHQPNLSS